MTSFTYTATRSIHADHIQSELVSNGDFSGGATGWTATGWTVTTLAAHDTGNTSSLSQVIGVTLGTNYIVTFTVSGQTAGALTPYIGTQAGTAITADGSYQETITATGNTTLAFSPTTDFDGAIDDISVVITDTWGRDAVSSSLTEKWQIRKNTQVSLNGTTETIYHRRDRVWDYTSDLISRSDLTDAYWYEMLDSISGGEEFTFDPYGTIATPDNAVSAIMIGEPRFRAVGALYTRVSFTVREI